MEIEYYVELNFDYFRAEILSNKLTMYTICIKIKEKRKKVII